MPSLNSLRSTKPDHPAFARLLITGARGFVGRHMVRRALECFPSAEIYASDLGEQGWRVKEESTRRLHPLALDIRDRAACDRVLREVKPSHLLHAAALTAGTSSEIQAVNHTGTGHIMDAALACGSVERCLLLSSSAVYGAPRDGALCDENHTLHLESAYARSKRDAEHCMAEREARSGVPMISARLGSCYGPGERVTRSRPRLSLVGQLLQAYRGRKTLRISGTDYCRDWTHLDEVFLALACLLERPKLGHRIYNVSAGESISARDMVRCFVEHGLAVTWTSAASSDIELRPADGRKPLVLDRIRSETGPHPVTNWRRGIALLLRQDAALAHEPDAMD